MFKTPNTIYYTVEHEGPPAWELDVRLTTLLRKGITVAKSKELKAGSNLAESFTDCYGSKGIFLPLMMMAHGVPSLLLIFYDKYITTVDMHMKLNLHCQYKQLKIVINIVLLSL